MGEELRKAVPLKLHSLKDLARLVVWWSFRERGTAIFCFKKGNEDKYIYGILTISPSYYEYRGLPFFIYAEGGAPEGSFLKYRTQPEEELTFSNDTEDPKYQYIPIIKLLEPPPFVRLD
ncbi:MAG: hypothetical protein ACTSXJ_07045 [Candidatus Baldrarchaeia archaeon]